MFRARLGENAVCRYCEKPIVYMMERGHYFENRVKWVHAESGYAHCGLEAAPAKVR